MKRFLVAALLLGAACSTPPPAPETTPQPQPAGQEKAIGTVKVTATTLNVRREASSTSEVIAKVNKGDRLALLSVSDDWDRVLGLPGDVDDLFLHIAGRRGSMARKVNDGDAAK